MDATQLKTMWIIHQSQSNVAPHSELFRLILLAQDQRSPPIAVLNYVAKKAGRQDLTGGDDLWEQSQVLKWSSFLSSEVHSSFWLVFFTNRFTTSDDPAALAQVKEAGLKRIHEKISILENHMKAPRQWLVGNNKTIADAHLYVFVRWMARNFSSMMEDFPNLKRFGERMAEDDGVKDALQYEDGAKWGMN